jgi:formylglycine-generating enzyme required for sulfatase activity
MSLKCGAVKTGIRAQALEAERDAGRSGDPAIRRSGKPVALTLALGVRRVYSNPQAMRCNHAVPFSRRAGDENRRLHCGCHSYYEDVFWCVMKTCFLMLILVLAVVAQSATPQQAQPPLTKEQVIGLLKAKMDNAQLAKLVRERGIDFEVTDDYLQALREAGAQDVLIEALRTAKLQPLTKDQVLRLVAGGVPGESAAGLVTQRGIDFLVDEPYLDMLRRLGADDSLIAALRQANKAVTPALVITTSADAEVRLGDVFNGRASPQGELTIRANPGVHTLKISLKGKKDYEQQVTLVGGQTTKIQAALVDLPGSIQVRTSPGAEVFLDDSSRGTVGGGGLLVVPDLAAGAHELRVTARGKKEFRQTITVLAGQESSIDAVLVEFKEPPLPAGAVRENQKDGLKYVRIPSGTFQMGCSPGDKSCENNEKPSHQVGVTKAFWIGQTEVTVGAYKCFEEASGRQMPHAPDFNNAWTNDNLPIVNVTWDEASAYCMWAGGRLPTEAEWEYAGRGGSREARYGNLDDIAWYGGNSGQRRHEVARKRANGFGLYDLLGNAWEWVNDWYDERYYQNSPSQDPSGPSSGQDRVLRGGSWISNPRNIRISVRGWSDPAGRSYAGFRCVRDVDSP